jgi:prephenate dehydrogenase
MTPLVDRLTVAGVGLIGGSLALAAREAGLVREVVGFGRSPENLRVALDRRIVDRVADSPRDAVAGAEVVVLAAPVGACAALAERFRPHVAPGTLLTDVGSVKASLVAALESCWADPGAVVGAHPVAGSEAAGAAAARADLFRGRLCIVTPTRRTHPEALARVRALWEGVGARVEQMDASAHDEILARVSHLPHLIAYALMDAVAAARVDGRSVLDYAGTGLRDTTRVAASRAELWRDIGLANAGALRAALGEFRVALDRLDALLAACDAAGLERVLDAAAAARRRLDGGGG